MTSDKSTIVTSYKSIEGFPGYRIGNNGDVQSCWTVGRNSHIGTTWKSMILNVLKSGYIHVGLYAYRKRFSRYVHRLVLESFVGPCPDGMECRHLDDNPSNNNLWNLTWGTPKENAGDRIRHGTTNRGERCKTSKMKSVQVLEIRRLYREGWTQKKIADKFSIHNVTVSEIILRKTWAHLP